MFLYKSRWTSHQITSSSTVSIELHLHAKFRIRKSRTLPIPQISHKRRQISKHAAKQTPKFIPSLSPQRTKTVLCSLDCTSRQQLSFHQWLLPPLFLTSSPLSPKSPVFPRSRSYPSPTTPSPKSSPAPLPPLSFHLTCPKFSPLLPLLPPNLSSLLSSASGSLFLTLASLSLSFSLFLGEVGPASAFVVTPPKKLQTDELATVKLFQENTPSVVYITNLAAR
jgi:hypothetical protein